MFFLVDSVRKIAFGWSAKCGCTHIKNLYHFLITGKPATNIHNGSYGKLPHDHKDYKIIIIIRNPYDRIVSGFLDKYKHGSGAFRSKAKSLDPLTFTKFVNELDTNGTGSIIDTHHFCPQLSENWNDDIIIHKIYDIKNIDYKYIESLYGIVIPKEVLNFRGNHENKNTDTHNFENLFDVHNMLYKFSKTKTSEFFNLDLANKVTKFYKKDIEFFNKHNFIYQTNGDLIQESK